MFRKSLSATLLIASFAMPVVAAANSPAELNDLEIAPRIPLTFATPTWPSQSRRILRCMSLPAP